MFPKHLPQVMRVLQRTSDRDKKIEVSLDRLL